MYDRKKQKPNKYKKSQSFWRQKHTILKILITIKLSEVIWNARTKTGNRLNNYLKELNEIKSQSKI